MIWLRIAGRPARQFYKDSDALPHLNAGEARHELLEDAGALRSGIDGETPNVSVTLRNSSGQCVDLFRIPPIGEAAELFDEAGSVFAGIVQSISLGDECTVVIQA